MPADRLSLVADPVVRADRRTFLRTAALGALVLAGCSGDGEATPSEPSGSTVPSGSTGTTGSTGSTGAATPTTSAPPVASPGSSPSVASTLPASVPPLPRSDRWWLDGNFGPVRGEFDSSELTITGRLPEALAGTWVRNGPNPDGDSPHWFLGNGTVHGVRLRGGRAEWYGRRHVVTPYLSDPAAGVPGGAISYSNVSSVFHAGRLLSLGELGFPYELDPDDLSTVGPYDFAGRLTTNMTAHPKIDPRTGEMLFFGYDFREPYLTYLVADASGTLRRSVPIGIGTPTMVHDVAITERSMIVLDTAVQFAIDEPGLPYRFDRSHRCRLGVVDREATTDTTRWFDIATCFVFHTVNAHQTGSLVTVDVVRYDEIWTQRATEEFPFAVPYRYTIDLDVGTVLEGPLDDRPAEFPMIDRRLVGRPITTSWAVSIGGAFSRPTSSTLLQYDADGSSDRSASFALPAGDVGAEPLFVADPERQQEGGGWLLMAVFRAETHTTDLVVFDAQAVADGPVATVHLPERVPYGFHASWTPLG